MRIWRNLALALLAVCAWQLPGDARSGSVPASMPASAPARAEGKPLTLAQKLAVTVKRLTKMRQVEVDLSKMVVRARANKEVVKLNCLKGFLAVIKRKIKKGLLYYRRAKKLVVQSRGKGDIPPKQKKQRKAAFDQVTELHRHVVRLGAEAMTCSGSALAVDAPVLPDIDQEDPYQSPTWREPIPSRPPLLSPARP